MSNKFQIRKGFTLIELLVVISIIGVLSSLIMANVSGIRERARDAKRKSDMREVKTALQMYHNDNDDYPTTESFPTAGNPLQNSDRTTIYMKQIPAGPVEGEIYHYLKGDDKDSYTLKTTLENKSDAEAGKSQIKCGVEESAAADYYVCPD